MFMETNERIRFSGYENPKTISLLPVSIFLIDTISTLALMHRFFLSGDTYLLGEDCTPSSTSINSDVAVAMSQRACDVIW